MEGYKLIAEKKESNRIINYALVHPLLTDILGDV